MRTALRRLGKGIALDLQAASAFLGIPLQLGFDPVGRRAHSLALRKVSIHAGDGAAIVERNQRRDRMLYFRCRNAGKGIRNLLVRRSSKNRRSFCIQIAFSVVRESRRSYHRQKQQPSDSENNANEGLSPEAKRVTVHAGTPLIAVW